MTEKEILYLFQNKIVGTRYMKKCICHVLSKMPNEVILDITKNCWFLGSFDNAWGFTFTGNDLSNKHMIFLTDDLFYQSKSQAYYTISHEIGHVVLRHRNSVFEKQSKEEIKKQEFEADKFAIDMGFGLKA